MDKLEKDFIRSALKGIWSPFFRRRISKELQAHLEDLRLEQELTVKESLLRLGSPDDLNEFYRNLFVKKLRRDLMIYGSLTLCSFAVLLHFVSTSVEGYIDWSRSRYHVSRDAFMQDWRTVPKFSRHSLINNADEYIELSLERYKDGPLPSSVLEGLLAYDYWDPYEKFDGEGRKFPFYHLLPELQKMERLLEASDDDLGESTDPTAALVRRQNLAQLIYSTESLMGFRFAHKLKSTKPSSVRVFNDYAAKTAPDRVSYQILSLANLMPSLIEFVEDIQDDDLFSTGMCHHAIEFWYLDKQYQPLLERGYPLEYSHFPELKALATLKERLREDCRLSFLDSSQDPVKFELMTALQRIELSRVVGSKGTYQFIPFSAVLASTHIPYLRPLATRYVLWQDAISFERKSAYVPEKDRLK